MTDPSGGWSLGKVLGFIVALLGMMGFGVCGLCGIGLGEPGLGGLGLLVALGFGALLVAILRKKGAGE